MEIFARLACIIAEFNMSLEEDRDILKEECGELFQNLERFLRTHFIIRL